jgi:hypothetical protein
MNEDKKYDKRLINRAFEELVENLNNVLNARRGQYPQRIKQLLAVIKNNEILKLIIEPYINMKLDHEIIGFMETEHDFYFDFIIPENEDEEIALILNTITAFADNEDNIDHYTVSVTMINNFEDSLLCFNKDCIEPAFKKLLRKLQYKLEDIGAIQDDEVKAGDITIIKIGELHAKNSMVAVGKDIIQRSENVFEKIRNEIINNVENDDDKKVLLFFISEMEKNKSNRETFREYYDKFINKLGIYMSIIGPMLPMLVDYIK